jgi:hypothetical protein
MKIHLLASILSVSLALVGCADSPTGPTPPATAASTFLSLAGSPGEMLTNGTPRRYTLADGVWTARLWRYDNGNQQIEVRLSSPPNTSYFSLNLAPPDGQTLAPGTYENARRWPFAAGQPGFALGVDSMTCGRLTGRFVIHSLKLGAADSVDRLHVTFDHYCDGASALLRGELSIVADPWR